MMQMNPWRSMVKGSLSQALTKASTSALMLSQACFLNIYLNSLEEHSQNAEKISSILPINLRTTTGTDAEEEKKLKRKSKSLSLKQRCNKKLKFLSLKQRWNKKLKSLKLRLRKNKKWINQSLLKIKRNRKNLRLRQAKLKRIRWSRLLTTFQKLWVKASTNPIDLFLTIQT